MIKKNTHSDMSDLSRSIGQLEGQITNLTHSIHELKCAGDNIQRRLGSVEKQHSFIRGSVSAILFLGTLFGAALDHIIKWVISR